MGTTPTPSSEFLKSLFPDVVITSTTRSKNHPLTKANPTSYHANSNYAVDLKPIKGLTFAEFKAKLQATGVKIFEIIDETGKGRTKHATGAHWHVAFDPSGVAPSEAKAQGFDIGDFDPTGIVDGIGYANDVFSVEFMARIVAVVIGVIFIGLAIAAFTLLGKDATIGAAIKKFA